MTPVPRPQPDRRHRRRRFRMLGAAPAVVASWVVLAGIPFAPKAPSPPGMHTEILTLTGSSGVTTRPAGAARGAAPAQAAPATAKAGWSASVDVADGTQAVGVSWTKSPTGATEVRGHTADGWTDWQELEANPDEAPDDSRRDAGGMAWFGTDGVDQVELRVLHGTLVDLELQTMRYEPPGDAPSGTATAAEGAIAAVGASAATKPTIQPRSLWTTKGWATQNSGCASGPTTASSGLKLAFVHHTVNANTYDAADVPAMIASIYAYHTGTNGWCDIAYNFIVDRFGRTWEARSGGVDKAIIGGHTQGFNTGSVGVSFLGQYEPGASPTSASPSSAALAAAGRLIGWKLGMYGIDPTGSVSVTSGGSNKWPSGTAVTLKRVSGHRDVGLTACPGQLLFDHLATIRTAAKAAQNTTTPTTTTTRPPTTTTTTTTPPATGTYAPFKSAWGVVSQGYRDVLYRSPSQADLDYWTSRVGTTWSPSRFLTHLLSSNESDQRVGSVIRLYRAYLLRNPDHGGFTYWVQQHADGRSLLAISSSFARSSEFRNRYGALSDAAFVDLVYRNVLGRPADSGGRAYWIRQLSGGFSRGRMMANFAESNEYRSDTADVTQVVATFEALLRRAVRDDVQQLYLAGLRSSGLSHLTITASIYASAEYRARFS